MKPNEKPDPQDRVRKLVAEYSVNGSGALSNMHWSEKQLLLSAKKLHLGLVLGRLERGEGTFVNAPLKRILESDCKTIERSLAKDDNDLEF